MIGVRAILAAFGVALVMILGGLIWHAAPPIGLPFVGQIFAGGSGARLSVAAGRITDLEAELAETIIARDGWAASFDASEAARRAEQETARDAIRDLEAGHAADLDAARNAGANAVRIIYQEPEIYDQDNCPPRALLGVDRLRDAIGARAPD